MALENINWNGLYARYPGKRSFAERRIRLHFEVVFHLQGVVVQASVRYVFPLLVPFLLTLTGHVDPQVGTVKAAN